ncbi:MAG: M15 family metallopeptidase [Myxococcota bacterium]|nr:M15 family metallopeptidase [Myxococcota bacterium]
MHGLISRTVVRWSLLLILGLSVAAHAGEASFEGRAGPLSPQLRAEMTGVSWRPGCPVALDQLVLLRLSHWGFDGKVHPGELVVHQRVAQELVALFRVLFEARFPIERMQRIEAYGGDDDRSMAANNTSAFNCRAVEGTQVFSRHAYGMAIDLNPLLNPYVRDQDVRPPAGRAHLHRRLAVPGLIRAGDRVHQAFLQRGWRWGGSWRTLRDYQHFEKRG